MKKFLPKTIKNPQGFTLIELMVVISIIAILSIIGIALYTNVQKNARDARRKADIDAIANALEVNYSDSGGKYTALATSQFSSGTFPKDPMDAATTCLDSYCGYCGISDSTTGAACSASNISTTVPVSATAGLTKWAVCANLETAVNGSNHYCKSSVR